MEKFVELQTFLEDVQKELEEKIKEVNEALSVIKADDSDVFQGLEKTFEESYRRTAEMFESVKSFKTSLVEKNLIKCIIPRINLLNVDERKRDSGLASSISSASPQTSTSRFSGADYDGGETRSDVRFNLMSTNTSFCDFGNETEQNLEPEPILNPKDLSTLYIHLVPSDPNIDLSALREEIYNLSRETVKSNKVQLHVVPSDSFIGIPSRHMSNSSDMQTSVLRQVSTSSDRLYSGTVHPPSSTESLMAVWCSGLSQKTPAEHSDLSDENSSRHVSSSDSEIRLMCTTGTQTDQPIEYYPITRNPSGHNLSGQNLFEYNPMIENPSGHNPIEYSPMVGVPIEYNPIEYNPMVPSEHNPMTEIPSEHNPMTEIPSEHNPVEINMISRHPSEHNPI